MDIGTLQAIGTVLTFIAFVGICLWAYNGKRKKEFAEAADLPFADEPGTTDRKLHDRGNQS